MSVQYKFTMITNGQMYVTKAGMTQRLLLCVENWAISTELPNVALPWEFLKQLMFGWITGK